MNLRKKILFSFFIIFTLIQCSPNNKQKFNEKIIGKWYSSSTDALQEESEEDIGVSLLGEEYITYKENGVFESYGTIKYLFSDKNRVYSMNYKVALNGNWEIKDGKIYSNPNIETLKFQFLNSNARSYEEKEMVRSTKQMFTLSAFKSAVIEFGDKPDKIVSLDDNYFITKDFEGEITKSKRIEINQPTIPSIPYGWEKPKFSNYEKDSGWDYFSKQGNSKPFYTTGDFNDDNIEDSAWILINPNNFNWELFAFISNGNNSFKTIDIGGQRKSIDNPENLFTGSITETEIATLKERKKICQYNQGDFVKSVNMKYDAIIFGVYEGNRVVLYYNKSKREFEVYLNCD